MTEMTTNERELIILFDLENTIIRHWDDPTLINIVQINNFVSSIKRKNITYGIYSYALWSDLNIRSFNMGIRKDLENNYKIKFDDEYIFNIRDVIRDFGLKNINLEYGIYCLAINKEKSILDFQKNNLKFIGKDLILIDHSVHHSMKVNYQDADKTILFLNPDKLDDKLIKI